MAAIAAHFFRNPRSLFRRNFASMANSFICPQHRNLTGPLDKSLFQKTVKLLAARVDAPKAGAILKAEVARNFLLQQARLKRVVVGPEGTRLVIFRVADEADLSPELRKYLEDANAKLVPYTINLDYNFWSVEEILDSILPEELVEGSPKGFTAVGHIAHLNLNNEYLPYKYQIGQLILDKNTSIKTVVNKIDSIDTQFRFFKMELLAGEPNYTVEQHESGCRFTFDFSEVYWNSRLHHEHARLVETFKPEDVIADVMAGVGPFAIPAAKRGCGVYANDLNPACHKYLKQNIVDNSVHNLVQAFNEDGRVFIRSVISRALYDPMPPYETPKSKNQIIREQKLKKKRGRTPLSPSEGKRRRRIRHFVMNLPDSAIEFLDAYRGILAADNAEGRDLSDVYDEEELPMVHVYCFARQKELDKAEVEIRERIEAKLGSPLGKEVSLHYVRSVAPSKEMYCCSFRLTPEVVYAS